MARRRTSGGAGLLLLLVAACSSSSGSQGMVTLDNVVNHYSKYAYSTDQFGERTSGPRYLVRVGTEDGQSGRSDEQDIQIGVGLLLGSSAPRPPSVSYWNGACAAGQRVQDVELDEVRVLVRFVQQPVGHDSCRLSFKENEERRQQLAWTVAGNLYGRAIEGRLPVVDVVDAGGVTWPGITPNPSFIEPVDVPVALPPDYRDRAVQAAPGPLDSSLQDDRAVRTVLNGGVQADLFLSGQASPPAGERPQDTADRAGGKLEGRDRGWPQSVLAVVNGQDDAYEGAPVSIRLQQGDVALWFSTTGDPDGTHLAQLRTWALATIRPD